MYVKTSQPMISKRSCDDRSLGKLWGFVLRDREEDIFRTKWVQTDVGRGTMVPGAEAKGTRERKVLNLETKQHKNEYIKGRHRRTKWKDLWGSRNRVLGSINSKNKYESLQIVGSQKKKGLVRNSTVEQEEITYVVEENLDFYNYYRATNKKFKNRGTNQRRRRFIEHRQRRQNRDRKEDLREEPRE